VERLQQFAKVLFERIQIETALLAKQMGRSFGVEGGSVNVVQGEYGPELQRTQENITLRVWAAPHGPEGAVHGMKVLGYIWARITTQPSDRCIGAVVYAGNDDWQWVALPAGFGDLGTSNVVMMHGSTRPGVDRLLEVFHEFAVAVTARWAGRIIDQHMGGDGA